MPNIDTEFQSQYAALAGGAGVVDFTSRTQLELTGADRASFLHNLCTNSVRDLAPGSGCEAFVLNVKGHIVGTFSSSPVRIRMSSRPCLARPKNCWRISIAT